MTISKHSETFAGLPVKQFDPSAKQSGKFAYRLTLEYDDKQSFPELLDLFLDRHGDDELTTLLIGAWNSEQMMDSASEIVESLVAARDRMPKLRSLFVGDITYEECEISWIQYGDISALLPAFPSLEEFRIRGATNLSFGTLGHPRLKSFAIESGGLPTELLDEVWAADLPNLEHLELWLGDGNYGGIGNNLPLEPLFDGTRFPKLKYLGLRNSDIADLVAAGIAASPLLARLTILDLSLGNLGDEGAEALIASPDTRKLQKLDLHYHYLSDDVAARLNGLGIEVDLSDPKDSETDPDDRYITVAE